MFGDALCKARNIRNISHFGVTVKMILESFSAIAMCTLSDILTLSLPLTLQAEMKKELIPLKKNLRGLYEAKQECDDITVHMKVSINTQIRETLEASARLLT